jgi:endonuclease/exonuclease/phosphatase family metal-dependent hydrolase
MAIYDPQTEIELNVCYDPQTGESLNKAYDPQTGEEIWSSDRTYKVMTYNVQWFTGINSQQAMQQLIINTYNADIIGLQELSKNGIVPTVGTNVLNGYPVLQLSNHKNYIGMASKYALSNIIIADFVNQDPEDVSRYHETRAYMMADINLDGKTVKWINTHLCLTNEYKYLQMAEIFELAENYDYVIITGDFNAYDYTLPDSMEYNKMFKPFVDAGYNVANNNGVSFTKTYSGSASALSLSDFSTPPDDIITSGNIDIIDVDFDTTKLSYLNGNVIDHIPVVATLRLS